MPSINRQLNLLYTELSSVTEKWAITGGSNHFIRKIDNSINDIDIITTAKGGEEITKALEQYLIQEYKFSVCNTIKSYFGVLNYKGIKIEVMGDPINFIKNKWIENHVWKNNIEFVGCKDFILPLTTLKYELYIYKLLKNQSKVEKLGMFNKNSNKEVAR
ncbi:MAG: hypothetical protein PHI02_05475 [Sulfurovaceae bacterium]|nr:hypothetical protein [Sulfurovaceae bacterium]